MAHRWISSVSSLQPPRPRQKTRSDWLIPPSILRRLSSHAGSGEGEERGFCDPGSEYNGKMKHDEYDYVVVARGFDALWFRHLLDEVTHVRMAEVTHSFDGRTIEH